MRCVADWDMFTLTEWHSYIHGAARVLSGGPIYVSDSARALDRDVQAVKTSVVLHFPLGFNIPVLKSSAAGKR